MDALVDLFWGPPLIWVFLKPVHKAAGAYLWVCFIVHILKKTNYNAGAAGEQLSQSSSAPRIHQWPLYAPLASEKKHETVVQYKISAKQLLLLIVIMLFFFFRLAT